jgi:hypothetical protein
MRFMAMNKIIKGADMKQHEWDCEEAGWYTHPEYGGICNEGDGWYFYPLKHKNRIGPFKTLQNAKNEAEKA